MHQIAKLILISVILKFCFGSEDNVVEYTDDDFKTRIQEHKMAVVMFYAPWCGHCKKMKPAFAEAATELANYKHPVVFVKVNCDETGKKVCEEHSVTGYPTIKIFREGKFSQDYSGPREKKSLVKFMKKHAGPAATTLESSEEFEKFVRGRAVAVVGFFVDNVPLKEAFLEAAQILKGKGKYGLVSLPGLNNQSVENGIILYRPLYLKNIFEERSVVYAGETSVDDIKGFIVKNYHGLVGFRKPSNVKEFKNPQVVAYYDVDFVRDAKGTNYWRNRVLKVASKYKELTFSVSARDFFQQELSNEYNLPATAGEKPSIVARDIKNRKYIMKEPFSVEALNEFVENFLAAKLEPFMKSEDIPKSSGNSVKVAVGKNFDDVVINNNKDTLVEFYAPWCGHCKKLAPVYESLAEKLKNEDIDIVKMDATANDVPAPYVVDLYPTLYWVPKGYKDKPVKYEGKRELNDFIKYVARHATAELKGYDRDGNDKTAKTEL